MKTFLFVIALAALFVLWPVLAMRPSPRQAQLARLRARAVGAGLRVRVSGSGARGGDTDYVLPWRIEELPEVHGVRLGAHRDPSGAWVCDACDALSEASLGAALGALPAGVATLRCADEGLAVQWNEKGRDEDVDRVAGVLLELRGALLAARRTRAATPDEADVRT